MPVLEGLHSGSTAQMHYPVWQGTGVEIDIMHTLATGDRHVYEVKAGTARALDAYQLLMYWDATVKDTGQSPQLGRLVANDIPQSVQNVIAEMNARKDSSGQPYKIEWEKLAQFGL